MARRPRQDYEMYIVYTPGCRGRSHPPSALTWPQADTTRGMVALLEEAEARQPPPPGVLLARSASRAGASLARTASSAGGRL